MRRRARTPALAQDADADPQEAEEQSGVSTIIVLLLAWTFWPEQPVPTAEESFIGPQLQPMKKAEQVEDQYMDALERKNRALEEQSDGG